MAFVPAQKAVKAIMQFRINGVPAKAYIIHFEWIGLGLITQSALMALDNALDSWVTLSLAPAHGAGWGLEGIRYRSLESYTAPAYENIYPDAVVGTRSGPTMPSNVCIAVHKSTSNGSRSGQGRVFHTALTETDVTGNTLSPAAAAVISNCWNALGGASIEAEFTPAVVSYQNNGVPRSEGLAQAITGWGLRDLRVDTQRKRLS